MLIDLVFILVVQIKSIKFYVGSWAWKMMTV